MRRTLVFLTVAGFLVTSSPGTAAPAHPKSAIVARAVSPSAAALAGKRVAWDEWPGAHRLLWSAVRRRPQVIARLPNPEDESFLSSLAGSSRLLAWEYSIEVGDRLSAEEQLSYYVRRKGKTKRVARCQNYGGETPGVDVSGSAMVVGCGGTASNIRVFDFARGSKPKVYPIVAHFPTGPVQLAGRFVAWREYEFFIDRIVVWDWKAGKEAYRFYPPGESGLNFDLQSDGKIALTYMPDLNKSVVSLAWFSQQEPTPHALATDGDFREVFISGNRVAYTRAGKAPFRYAVLDLNGNVVAEFAGSRLRSYMQDFNGRCVAWIDYTRKKKKRGAAILVTPIVRRGC